MSTENLTTLRLVAYLRVSTESQALAGTSVPEQRRVVEQWASEHGYEIVSVHCDNGISGTLDTEDRPGLAAALVEIEDGSADGLVMVALDRLARELHIQEAALARCWAAGGRVFEVRGEILRDDPSDPYRTFVRQVMGAASQLEAGMIRARLRRGRQAKARAGGYVGGSRLHRRYGYKLVRGENGKHDTYPSSLSRQPSAGSLRYGGRA
jgi:DNA invertase Pin-like site-specific DNA recombinase